MGTKKGQSRKTARKAYEQPLPNKSGKKPKGKRGAIFYTKGGRMRVRYSSEAIAKSVRLKHIFKGWF